MLVTLKRFALPVLIAASLTASSPSTAASSSSSRLPAVDLDGFLEALIVPGPVAVRPRGAFGGGEPGLFEEMFERYGRRPSDARQLSQWATEIAGLRQRIRSGRKDLRKVRESLMLLDLLLDEMLYAGKLLFGDFPEQWMVQYSSLTPSCQKVDFLGASICQGDLVVSLGRSFRSAVVLSFSRVPGTYAHLALPVWRPKEKRMLFFEGVPDGVGLVEIPTPSFKDQWPLKLLVYRNQDKPMARKFSDALGRFVEGGSKGKNAKLFEPVYSFDYGLTPSCGDARYFCSEIPYCISTEQRLPESANPLPKKYWGLTQQDAKRMPYAVWELPKRLPFSSDFELNPKLEPVLQVVDVTSIEEKRFLHAAVMAFASVFEARPDLNARYLRAIAPFRQMKLKSLKKEALVKAGVGFVTPELVNSLVRLAQGDGNLGQTILFYHLEAELIPRLREEVRVEVAQLPGKRIGLNRLHELLVEKFAREIARFVAVLERHRP